MKLELKHLAPYQEHGIKLMDHFGNKCNIAYLSTKRIAFIDIMGIGEVQKLRWEYATGKIKPILNPMSMYCGKMIAKEAMSLLDCDFDTINEIWDLDSGVINLEDIKLKTYITMCKNLIDFNKLIENDLAININTL